MTDRRLFVFGCSYTNYAWPTWANFLSIEYKNFQNWAMPGLGNRAIAERVAECCCRHEFNKNDLVIVQWSSHLRNDWYNVDNTQTGMGGWRTRGSIFNYINLERIYDRKWIERFWFEPAYIMHTINNIRLVQGLLESTGCEYYMTGMGDIREIGADIITDTIHGENVSGSAEDRANSKLIGKHLLYYREPAFEIYEKQIWQDRADKWLTPLNPFAADYPEHNFYFVDKTSKAEYQDYHPTPKQHVFWIEKNLRDRLRLTDDAINEMHKFADLVHAMQPNFIEDKDLFGILLGKRRGFENHPISYPNMDIPGF